MGVAATANCAHAPDVRSGNPLIFVREDISAKPTHPAVLVTDNTFIPMSFALCDHKLSIKAFYTNVCFCLHSKCVLSVCVLSRSYLITPILLQNKLSHIVVSIMCTMDRPHLPDTNVLNALTPFTFTYNCRRPYRSKQHRNTERNLYATGVPLWNRKMYFIIRFNHKISQFMVLECIKQIYLKLRRKM